MIPKVFETGKDLKEKIRSYLIDKTNHSQNPNYAFTGFGVGEEQTYVHKRYAVKISSDNGIVIFAPNERKANRAYSKLVRLASKN